MEWTEQAPPQIMINFRGLDGLRRVNPLTIQLAWEDVGNDVA
jgi:hypothetical protein